TEPVRHPDGQIPGHGHLLAVEGALAAAAGDQVPRGQVGDILRYGQDAPGHAVAERREVLAGRPGQQQVVPDAAGPDRRPLLAQPSARVASRMVRSVPGLITEYWVATRTSPRRSSGACSVTSTTSPPRATILVISLIDDPGGARGGRLPRNQQSL